MARYEGGGGGGGGAVTIAGSGPIGVAGGPAFTISIANVSNTTPGASPAITAANLPLVSNGTGTAASWTQITLAAIAASGAAVNQYPSWNGANWVPATPLTSPANPGDNTKVPIVNAGDFTYGFIANAQISTTAAIATSKLAVGTAGQALITTAGVATWGSDFVATELITTGDFRANSLTAFFAVGTTTVGSTRSALTGSIRVPQGVLTTGVPLIVGRNITDTGDRILMSFGLLGNDLLAVGSGALTLQLGSTTTSTNVNSSGGLALNTNGGTASYTFNSTTALWASNATIRGNATIALELLDVATVGASGGRTSVRGGNITGSGAASFGGPVQLLPGTGTGGQNGNLELFGASGSTKENGMGFGYYMKDRSSVPTAGPATSGHFHYSDTGGLPTWVTAANNFFTLTGVTTNTATTGALAALPALPLGYTGVVVMPVGGGAPIAAKIPFYAP